jgi:hypothetical protein
VLVSVGCQKRTNITQRHWECTSFH